MTRRNANLVTADFQAAYGQVTLLSVENNSGAASNQNNLAIEIIRYFWCKVAKIHADGILTAHPGSIKYGTKGLHKN